MSERLEALSDMVRQGIPIDFCDAIAVIEYQDRLRIERADRWNKSIIGRLVNLFRYNNRREAGGGGSCLAKFLS